LHLDRLAEASSEFRLVLQHQFAYRSSVDHKQKLFLKIKASVSTGAFVVAIIIA